MNAWQWQLTARQFLDEGARVLEHALALLAPVLAVLPACLQWAGAAACTVVIVACICRVNLLHPRSPLAWPAKYILQAAFAGGVLIDLVQGFQVDWYVAFGVAGALLHIVLTWHKWSRRAPAETESKSCS